MVLTEATTRLIHRARGVIVRHYWFRAAGRGVAAGALLAAMAAAVARLLQQEPGVWLVLSALPALGVFALGLRRARTTLTRAAILLDRSAGTRERFLATLTAADPEVRDLAAEQALSAPALSGGAFPLRFPPSTEGLAAAFATAILIGVLVLPGRSPKDAPGSQLPGRAVSALPGRPGDTPGTPRDGEIPTEPAAPRPAEVDQITRRMAAGEEIDAEDWKALEQAGLAKQVRREVVAALDRGEPGRAVEAVQRALRRGRREGAGELAHPSGEAGWDEFRRALESPIWSPRYDAVVRRYFAGAEEAGLR